MTELRKQLEQRDKSEARALLAEVNADVLSPKFIDLEKEVRELRTFMMSDFRKLQQRAQDAENECERLREENILAWNSTVYSLAPSMEPSISLTDSLRSTTSLATPESLPVAISAKLEGDGWYS